MFHRVLKLAASLLFLVCTHPAGAASLSPGLVEQLRHGGYVLVMRHASSPANPPDKQHADPQNLTLERQLDDKGRTTAQAMGRAFKALRIPLGEIFSSPTYRARETIRLANFGAPQPVAALGDQGRSMAQIQGNGPAEWLKAKVAQKPAGGANTILVTHMPNIAAAFPDDSKDLQDGETLIFQPQSAGPARMIARVPIEDWDKLAR